MKIKAIIILCIATIFVFFIINRLESKRTLDTNVLLLPSLPRPIAKEYALITSAGQSTDAYIINDIANKLMVHNYFMPQARDTDLEGINTLVIVAGYSPVGEKLNGTSYDSEKLRIKALISKAKEKNLCVVTVYISGKERRDKNTDELLAMIVPVTNYLIGTKDSNEDSFLSALAKKNGIPLTLINGVNNITEPFASAFR